MGAGIAGIAAAIRLAVKGYAVEIFEVNTSPGGKLAEINKDKFRFDAGPSLLTLPQYIDDLFELAGKKPADYFEYQQLDVICKYFYADGTKLTAYADREKFEQEITTHTTENRDALRNQAAKSATIYELTSPVF
ncbi:phytoene desaturase family protein [Mucilaginibacter antarcticus]|uniref:phytoene desaturase family protein n=1 Tax=Mucilaginibacter antarcticus TaxID=1855725 RepID=UPI00362B6115